MATFSQKVAIIAGQNPDFSMGERLIILRLAQDFERRYQNATGEEPPASIPLLETLHGGVKEYDIEIPIIANWIKEDTQMINAVLMQKRQPQRGISNR